jgi:hypothetical protein
MEAPQGEQEYRLARSRLLAGLPRTALAWLALAPEWPEELVSENFPGPPPEPNIRVAAETSWPRTPVDMLNLSAQGKWSLNAPGTLLLERTNARVRNPLPPVQTSESTGPWEGQTFRIAPELRATALEDLLEEPASEESLRGKQAGLGYVRSQLKRAASVMLQSEKLEEYPPLWRWAQLASRADSDEALRAYLDSQITDAIRNAEEHSDQGAPEALRWIEAAESFAEIFQGKLELSLTLARRKRELFNRRAYDRRKLANYYRREDQLVAFRELLTDREHWALHYAGGGGLGKTMLLRYLTQYEARDPQGVPRIIVSRVDFDFLHPDYPFRAPGLLLSALAEELRLQAGPAATSIFASLDAWIVQLHDEVTRNSGGIRLISLDDRLFTQVIAFFADACSVVGTVNPTEAPRPVVLMLDTCEELSKLRFDGSVPENVRVTFEILQRVKERAGNVRVVFSGRRALARKGWDWESDSPLPERSYLRLFRVEGFSDREALQFLSEFKLNDKKVPEAFIEPILNLTRSAAADEESRFRIVAEAGDQSAKSLKNDASDSLGSDAQLRHNPFDLDMYADWVVGDTDVTLETLRIGGRHLYIEQRILRRLNSRMRELLPQLAALGRFDRPLLIALTANYKEPVNLQEEVVSQEWVRAERGAATDKWLVEPGLRTRILDYYREREPGELRNARRALADVLVRITLNHSLDRLAEQYFGAAFDTLQEDPEAAARWWMQVEERIARENAWLNWGQPLMSHLLAEPVLSAEAPRSFRAAVLATQASVTLHTGDGDVRAAWQRAEESLPAYPAQTGRSRLEFRIACGVQTMFRKLPEIGALAGDPQCRAAWLAGAETLVEMAEREAGDSPSLEWLHEDADPYVKAFALCLSARREMRKQEKQAAASLFEQARSAARELSTSAAWLDWRVPDNLKSRIDLECLRAMPELTERITPQLDPLAAARTIDDDRMWSAVLLYTEPANVNLQPGPVTSRPGCNAHFKFLPLAIVLAERIARARPVDGLHQLRGYSESARAEGLPEICLDADRAITRIIRRGRLLSENLVIPPAVAESAEPYDIWLRSTTNALHLSGEALENLLKTFEDFPLTQEPRATWVHAEVLLAGLDSAQVRQKDNVAERASEAARAFEEAGDANGVLICRLIDALSRARAGEKLDVVVAELQHLQLPESSWERIVQAAMTDDPVFLDSVSPNWRPWIARALAVFVRFHRPRKSMQPRRILEWLRTNYSFEAGDRKLLPFELAFLERTSGAAERIGTWIGYLISGGFLALIVVVSWKITASTRFTGVLGIGKHIGMMAGLWLAVLVVIGLVGNFFQWLAKRFAALSWIGSPLSVACGIDLEGTPGDPNRPMTLPWQATITARMFYFSFRPGSKFSRKPTGDDRYRYLYAPPEGKRNADATVRRVLETMKLLVDLRLTIDPAAAAGPWEAALSNLTPRDTRFSDVFYRFSRTLPGRTASAQHDWPNPVTISTWIYSGLGIDRATLTFSQQPGKDKRVFNSELLTRPSDYERIRYGTGVVHIFGTPAERSSDVFLRVGGMTREDPPHWLSAPEVRRRYPNARLLVVQAPPVEVHPRNESDRLQAAQLKRFGALAFQSGVPAVLVLPALPLQLAGAAMSKIFNLLVRNRKNASGALILMARRLQEEVGALKAADIDVPIELAFDICLYVDEQVNFRMRETAESTMVQSILK